MIFSQDIYVRAYGLEFVWDSAKEQKVKKDHGVPFTDALSIFVDPYRRLTICNEPDANFALIGRGADKILYVAYGYRIRNQSIRLTAVRKADSAHNQEYQKNICQYHGISLPKKGKKS